MARRNNHSLPFSTSLMPVLQAIRVVYNFTHLLTGLKIAHFWNWMRNRSTIDCPLKGKEDVVYKSPTNYVIKYPSNADRPRWGVAPQTAIKYWYGSLSFFSSIYCSQIQKILKLINTFLTSFNGTVALKVHNFIYIFILE